jgi:hypothetical protein
MLEKVRRYRHVNFEPVCRPAGAKGFADACGVEVIVRCLLKCRPRLAFGRVNRELDVVIAGGFGLDDFTSRLSLAIAPIHVAIGKRYHHTPSSLVHSTGLGL